MLSLVTVILGLVSNIVLVLRFSSPPSILHVCIEMFLFQAMVHFTVTVRVEQVETFATKDRHAWACTAKSITAS